MKRYAQAGRGVAGKTVRGRPETSQIGKRNEPINLLPTD
jgi:hypothetical protein